MAKLQRIVDAPDEVPDNELVVARATLVLDTAPEPPDEQTVFLPLGEASEPGSDVTRPPFSRTTRGKRQRRGSGMRRRRRRRAFSNFKMRTSRILYHRRRIRRTSNTRRTNLLRRRSRVYRRDQRANKRNLQRGSMTRNLPTIRTGTMNALNLSKLGNFRATTRHFNRMTTTRGHRANGTTSLNVNTSTRLKRTVVGRRRLRRRQYITKRLSMGARSLPRGKRLIVLSRYTNGTGSSNGGSTYGTRPRNGCDNLLMRQRVLLSHVPIRYQVPPLCPSLQIGAGHPRTPSSDGLPNNRQRVLLHIPARGVRVYSRNVPCYETTNPKDIYNAAARYTAARRDHFLPR